MIDSLGLDSQTSLTLTNYSPHGRVDNLLLWISRLRVRFIDWLNNRLNGRMNGTSASMERNTSGTDQETSGAQDSQKCSLSLYVYKYRDNDSLICKL